MTIREEKMKTVLILRTCTASLTSQGGFQWPTSGHVAAPDWNPTQARGHGLHGLLWGCGDASLLDWSEQAKWLVVEVTEASIIDLGDKVKFPEGTVVYCGDRNGAANLIAADPRAAGKPIIAATVTAGFRGTATAGVDGTILIRYWAGTRFASMVGLVGENGIEADRPYGVRCRDGNYRFVPVEQQI